MTNKRIISAFAAPNALPAIRPAASQSVAVAVASAASAAAIGSPLVRLCSTTDCFIEFGAAPTAVAGTSLYLPADHVEYFSVDATHKVAVIRLAGDGTLYVTPAQTSA